MPRRTEAKTLSTGLARRPVHSAAGEHAPRRPYLRRLLLPRQRLQKISKRSPFKFTQSPLSARRDVAARMASTRPHMASKGADAGLQPYRPEGVAPGGALLPRLYARRCLRPGWSRSVGVHHISGSLGSVESQAEEAGFGVDGGPKEGAGIFPCSGRQACAGRPPSWGSGWGGQDQFPRLGESYAPPSPEGPSPTQTRLG